MLDRIKLLTFLRLTFKHTTHVMTTKHIHNSIVHCNSIVRLVANRALHCARSPMGANVAYLRCKYGVDFTNALNANINSINVFHQRDEHCHTVMSVLLDNLRNCLRGTVEIDGFSRNDMTNNGLHLC